MNRDPFVTGGIYHIYNRGTDKRDIFLDDNDHKRFIKSLLFFNNKGAIDLRALKESNTEMAPPEPKERLAGILAYCLMPNHYHLLVRETEKDGITHFMRKLGTGYTMYFNARYERSGVLFQGQFKSVLLDKDSYLQYIPHYIHLNPLDLIMPWREGKIDSKKATSFLKSYRWSSYPHYIEGENNPLLDIEFIKELYAPNEYKNDLFEWLKSSELETIRDVAIEALSTKVAPL